MKNTGKRYEQQFKDDIIRLVKVEKRTIASIERDFDVKQQTVRNWLKERKDADDRKWFVLQSLKLSCVKQTRKSPIRK